PGRSAPARAGAGSCELPVGPPGHATALSRGLARTPTDRRQARLETPVRDLDRADCSGAPSAGRARFALWAAPPPLAPAVPAPRGGRPREPFLPGTGRRRH